MLGKGQQQHRDPGHMTSTVNASAHLASSFPQPIGPISRDLGQTFPLHLNLCGDVVTAMLRGVSPSDYKANHVDDSC